MGKIYDALKKAERESKIRMQSDASHDKRDSIVIAKPAASEMHQKHSKKAGTIQSIKPRASVLEKTSRSQAKRTIDRAIEPFSNLFLLNDPTSLAAEQFRILRSRIFSANKKNTCYTILVTSCQAQEGKSTISSNLSIAIANTLNKSALLVDCDLRRPTIHNIFNLTKNPGLSNYLNEDVKLSAIIHDTMVDRLLTTTSGDYSDNPTELLGSHKMNNFMQDIKKRYSDYYIILDSTPASHTPEATILKEHADAIIFVVRAGKTNRAMIRKTIETLGKERILGIVFNMINEPIKSYYYPNYYYQIKND